MSKLNSSDLPSSWQYVSFEEVAILQRGYDLPAHEQIPGIYPIVTSGGVNGTHSHYMAKGPGVVTGRSGSIGKVYYVEDNYWPHNTALFVKDFKGNYPRFVYYLLKFMALENVANATGVPTLDRNNVHRISVPHPPVPEQQRIAAILDQKLAAVDKARAAAQVQLEAAQALPAAYLREVFDGPEAKGWPVKEIGQLLKEGILLHHQDGNHGELHPREKDFITSGVKFLTAKHIRLDGSLDFDNAPSISEQQVSGLRIGFAQAEDVLLAHNATVGPVAISPSDCKPFMVGTSLTIYRCNPTVMMPLFMFYLLRSTEFQNQLIAAMEQTTRNQVPITRQRLMTLRIPSMEDQVKILSKIQKQMHQCYQVIQRLDRQVEVIDKLPSTLLRQAFDGGL